jgi:hypothetical protein
MVVGVIATIAGLVAIAFPVPAIANSIEAAAAIMLPVELLLIVGIWQVTRPDSCRLLISRPNIVGWVARTAALGHYLAWAIILLKPWLEPLLRLPVWPSVSMLELHFLDLMMLWLCGSAAVAAAALAFRCRRIARRLPARTLAWQLFALFIAIAVGLSADLGAAACEDFRILRHPPLAYEPLVACWFLSHPAVVVALTVVLILFARALRRAATMTRGPSNRLGRPGPKEIDP